MRAASISERGTASKLAFNQTRFDYAAAITVFFFLLLLFITWTANRLSGGNAGAVDID